MAWMVGDESGYRLPEVAAGDSLRLADLLEDAPGCYLGYLLDGFGGDLERRFCPGRVCLTLRAGWSAVAVAVRTPDRVLARRLGPFLAPTAPLPHRAAPLGLALFSSQWLRRTLGDVAHESLPGLDWAARLSTLPGPDQPVFCDPVLELSLAGRTAEEAAACRYRPPPAWAGPARALVALGRPRWLTEGAGW